VNATFRRAIAALTIVFALALPLATPAAADDHGPTRGGNKDNSAVAINTKDGSSLFRFAFNIVKVTSNTVDSTNAAIAYASCTQCQTVAIAIQFVIVEGSPEVFTPENVAVAVNERCSMCDTLASAYQFVIQTPGPVRLTWEGRKQMWALTREIKALADSGLTGPEMQIKVNDIATRMHEVMKAELVPVHDDDDDREDERLDSTTTSEAPTSTSSTNSTAPASTTTAAKQTTTTTPTSSSTTSTTSTTTSSTSTTPTSTP
jgi:putative peptide zinc metalloprotease protein